jgi:hypothetical protein
MNLSNMCTQRSFLSSRMQKYSKTKRMHSWAESVRIEKG